MSGLAVTGLKQVTEFCPSQWHARSLDNRPVYIRFKHGNLSVNIGAMGGTIDDALDSPKWYSEQVASDHEDGIDFEEVCRLTGIILIP